ncbi:Por secretion system C-terminal sorting domain-containing protein [Flagellimonas flava]|uniref:Por secretion system C-terminal sorting domain-containing protein n=2 Tax=Flagellimonas flava TaxID=570519 RepID=A0A1M5NAJ9_9FLAO|nr:Por secretion system C-terminal sorting domain-containing protein [Allomuricauda flava]
MTAQIQITALLILCTFCSYGQCANCNNTTNTITYSGNGSFTTSKSQAYFWEICSGEAVIVGSNTNKTVNIQCNGSQDFKLKVTKFQNGQCTEACFVSTCKAGMVDEIPTDPGESEGNEEGNGMDDGSQGFGTCPNVNGLLVSNEGGGGVCTTAMVSVEDVPNADHYSWTWALGGYSGTLQTQGNMASIYFPEGNWSNYYLSICVEVAVKNNGSCSKICKSYLLECGNNNPSQYQKTMLYPNPSKNKVFIEKSNSHRKIEKIEVRNINGTIVQCLRSDLDGSVDLTEQEKGIYLLTMYYKDGKLETKKVIKLP